MADDPPKTTSVAKRRTAKVGLFAAIFFFVTGQLMLCYCPGWFAIGMGFSLLPVVFGERSVKWFGWIFFAASAFCTAGHYQLEMEEKRMWEQKLRERNQAVDQAKEAN